MRELRTDDKVFAAVERGLAWAAADLPGGWIEDGRIVSKHGDVALALDGSLPADGFATSRDGAGYTVRAARPRGFLSGILNLAERLRGGTDFVESAEPRFTSRFYKHEANILGTGDSAWRGHAWVGDLDEDFWVAYVKTLVRKHFTGLAFYAHYHPFEFFLDYDEFAEAPSVPKARRAKTLAALKRAFGVARAFGLETFMQHYLTHFPAGLAKAHDIVFKAEEAGSRLSALDHPVVDAYSRYIYRRTFELLPELSGFYVNFESAPNSSAFLERTLLPEALAAKTPPDLVLRLWDFNSPDAMRTILKTFPGKLRLAHKIQDRADYYYFPKADPRVIEWKRFFPETEFMFLVGPCHNCGTVQSRQLWCDADFVQDLLADAADKGADSFAFHTVYELLAQDIDASAIAHAREVDVALLNRGHLDAAVDFVRSERPSRAVLRRRLAERTGFDANRAAAAFEATRETSQVTLTTFRQFWHSTSEEGYQYPSIRSYYQDPFLHLTPRFVNDEPDNAITITTAWLNRNYRMRNVPDDTLPVIDFVNPDAPKAPLSPLAVAGKLKRHADKALAAARKAAGRSPRGIRATLLAEATRMHNWGMRDYWEMRAAVDLFGVYFSPSRTRTLSMLRRAADDLTHLRPYTKKGDPLAVRRHLWWQETEFEKDIKRLRSLAAAIEKRDFPYAAFAAYARSMERFNEIRRTVRPNKVVRPKDLRLIKRRLGEAVERAHESLALLEGRGHARLRANVAAWLEYLEFERAGVKPPSMEILSDKAAGTDRGFVPLVHDQCLRYGENAILDLAGFFKGRDWKRARDISFRMTHGPRGLTASLVERGCDARARMRRWKEFRATRSETFFWRLYIDRDRTERAMDIWCILSEGWALFKGGYEIVDRQNSILRTGQPVETGRGRFTHGRDWWRLDYLLPWRYLGGRAKAGDRWRINTTATPESGTPLLPSAPLEGRNKQYIWCPAYEMTAADDFIAGKPERMGTAVFR